MMEFYRCECGAVVNVCKKAEWSAGFEVRKTGTERRWNGMH